MLEDDPVTVWIDGLRNADPSAAEKLWKHFFQRLYLTARSRLQPKTRRVYDEEDAAQSAFQSACAGISAGRFPDLQDREGLWRLLLVITARKVARRHRYDGQQQRDVSRDVSDSIFLNPDSDSDFAAVNGIVSREPTPEYAAEFVETCEVLFADLEDPTLSKIAQLKIEGYTDREVGERMACSRRTVQRRLEIIRRRWKRLHESDTED